jgi:hypothetical protein
MYNFTLYSSLVFAGFSVSWPRQLKGRYFNEACYCLTQFTTYISRLGSRQFRAVHFIYCVRFVATVTWENLPVINPLQRILQITTASDWVYYVIRISVAGNWFVCNDMRLYWKPTRPFDVRGLFNAGMKIVCDIHYFLWEGIFSTSTFCKFKELHLTF